MTNSGLIERLSPLWIGIGISGSLILVLLITEIGLGRWDALVTQSEFDALARVSSGILRDLRLAIVHCLIVGYVTGALVQVLQNGRRTILLLQDVLDCTREECATLAASIKPSVRGLVTTGLVGLTLAFVTPYLVPPVQPEPWNPMTWSPEVAWHRTLGPVISVLQLWFVYTVFMVSMRMSRIAKKLTHVDLLDLTPLAPFTRLGLTNALLLIGMFSIASLMMLETGFGQLMMVIGSSTLVVAVLALVAPVGGVHSRIHECKNTELAWANGEISKRLDAFHGKDHSPANGEMADLISYRSLVERVPEWPFTTSTYTRLFVYLLIPLMFWGIGIIAETLVQSALS